MSRFLIVCVSVWLLLSCFGCQTVRRFDIDATPPGTVIRIDGIEQGRVPLRQVEMRFRSATDARSVTASRRGFLEQTRRVTRDHAGDRVSFALEPEQRPVRINVSPLAGVIRIDGQAITGGAVTSVTHPVDFQLDAQGNFRPRRITAERAGFKTAEFELSYDDRRGSVDLRLEPMRKTLRISTDPPGATVLLDGRVIAITSNQSPTIEVPDVVIEADESGRFRTYELIAKRPGYEDGVMPLSWDDGRSDYRIRLGVKNKDVRIRSVPPGAVVNFGGRIFEPGDDQVVRIPGMMFKPDERGNLPSFSGRLTLKTDDSEFYPADLTIGWDEGKSEYVVPLREILTLETPLITPTFVYDNLRWRLDFQTTQVVAFRRNKEGAGRDAATPVVQLSDGGVIGSIAVAPDGSMLVYSVLHDDNGKITSRLEAIALEDGAEPVRVLGGSFVDLHPAFSPDGSKLVFSSNRGQEREGRQLSLFELDVPQPDQPWGTPRRLTNDPAASDLSPSLDNTPEQGIYFESRVDAREQPRLTYIRRDRPARTDLVNLTGHAPRVHPGEGKLLFTQRVPGTEQGELIVTDLLGNNPVNLTRTDTTDERDAAWDPTGTRIVFASDRGLDPQERRQNYDLWLLDLAQLGRAPERLTTNGSLDDSPVFDPLGRTVYFRSNRHGVWGVWRVNLPPQPPR